MENKIICCECNKELDINERVLIGNKIFCVDCSGEFTECSTCGTVISKSDAQYHDEEAYCEDCFNDYFTTCCACDALISVDDAEYSDEYPYCRDCFYEDFVRCERCNIAVPVDEACYLANDSYHDAPYCQSCCDEIESSSHCIHSYSYKPNPIFYNELGYNTDTRANKYFGIELEIDKGGESNEKAKILLDLVNSENDYIYIKSDGSLSSGMEIVTHPMTFGFHYNRMPWQECLKKCVELGYVSHKSGTAGLHIHVNKNYFGPNGSKEQDDAIARLLFFIENNWMEITRFSRRTCLAIDKWASRYGRKDNPKEILDAAKDAPAQRYTCVNLLNFDTIEFRIFRGTLKYNTLIATIELIDIITDMAKECSDEEIKDLNWTKFVIGIDTSKYKELLQYLTERQLNVNEPVVCEEEV